MPGSSRDFIACIDRLSRKIFRENVKFKKAGVLLSKLTSEKNRQLDLFADRRKIARDQRLMQTIDTLNGSGKNVFFASEGLNASKPWQTKFNHRSARYTTNWNELVKVV